MNGSSFVERRVLVTGASSGIGAATARAVLRAGDYVIATGRQAGPLAALAGPAERDRLRGIPGDLRSGSFVDELLAQAGTVDVLVNCAGVLKHAPFLELAPVDWKEAFEVNVVALLALTQRVARDMAERQRGHIINISSTRADEVAPMTLVYSATKAALRAITKGLRAELRPYGVRVTEIAPGFTESNLRRDVRHPAALDAFVKRDFTALRAEDVAAAVLFAMQADENCAIDLLVLRPQGQA